MHSTMPGTSRVLSPGTSHGASQPMPIPCPRPEKSLSGEKSSSASLASAASATLPAVTPGRTAATPASTQAMAASKASIWPGTAGPIGLEREWSK
jgi:hypothetical protein